MSYDIQYKVKVEGVDAYVPIAYGGNITWNVGDMIRKATGLEWKNEANNGLCKDIMPYIEKGLKELKENREKYLSMESPNGWGKIKDVIEFFEKLIDAWKEVVYWHEELIDVLTFWVE